MRDIFGFMCDYSNGTKVLNTSSVLANRSKIKYSDENFVLFNDML